MRSSHSEEIAIVGIQTREARELALAAEAAGLAVRPLAFGSPLAEAAFAAHGPGSIQLPLAIVAGRYSLQRPAFGAVLECIEVLTGNRQTLPTACVVLACTADLDGQNSRRSSPEKPGRARRISLGLSDAGSPDPLGDSPSPLRATASDRKGTT
ncbi:MAG TPA: hypothetical protein VGF93_18810 [Solirubrobacteraceae bacterium]